MPPSAADVALPRMPPCARATVGQSWERSWPASTKRYSVGLPSPDRELPSRGSLHSSRTLGSGLPISTLFSLVLYVAGIVRGKNVGTPHPATWLAETYTFLGRGNRKGWRVLRDRERGDYRTFTTPEQAYNALVTLQKEIDALESQFGSL